MPLPLKKSRGQYVNLGYTWGEQFLASDADALAAMLRVHLGNMSLQPIGVLAAPFPLRCSPSR